MKLRLAKNQAVRKLPPAITEDDYVFVDLSTLLFGQEKYGCLLSNRRK